MIEILVIDAENHPKKFYCGIVLHNDRVVEAALIVRKMRGWSRERVRDYCKTKGWKIISIVHEVNR